MTNEILIQLFEIILPKMGWDRIILCLCSAIENRTIGRLDTESKELFVFEYTSKLRSLVTRQAEKEFQNG